MSDYFNSEAFRQQYHYVGDDLGVNYCTQVSIFKVWAPGADKVNVLLYGMGSGGTPLQQLTMERGDKGVWSAKGQGNLSGMYYTYLVTRNVKSYEVVDPYAKAVGVNGRRGMIMDMSHTDPEGWREHKQPMLASPTDAVIYELHIRDLSMDEHGHIEHKGKFLALTETGTTTDEGEKTGLDHIKELGVTHVQLLPCYDFISIDENRLDKNSFNWGYDPQNYNVPEGSYATDPYHGEVRIKEYKKAIMALHENNIGVIMDVVYNHTAQGEESLLNRLVPHYYHRVLRDGQYSNGSGCGNEIASERFMVRKMIIDSVVYWAREYKIDGFRFDLMGVLDIETMNMVRHALDKINPNIILYGEGWTGGLCAFNENERAVKRNVMRLERIGVFNDNLRDAVKGSVFDAGERGFISGKQGLEESVKFGIVAATAHNGIDYSRVDYSHAPYANEPGQCINYVEAHDNLTLWDKIKASAPEAAIEDKIAMQKLSGAVILTAQGVPFLHAGIEFARTKFQDSNSYRSPDRINMLRWRRKTIYREIFDYYKGLIEMRKAHPAFRMRKKEEIQQRLCFLQMPLSNMVGFKLISSPEQDPWHYIVVILNGNASQAEVHLEQADWLITANDKEAGTKTIKQISGNKVLVAARSAMVLVKKTEIDDDMG